MRRPSSSSSQSVFAMHLKVKLDEGYSAPCNASQTFTAAIFSAPKFWLLPEVFVSEPAVFVLIAFQTVVDTTGRLFQEVGDEASFLSASEEIEKFALEYAASHLPNGPEVLDFQSENLGKITIPLPLRRGFYGRRRLRKALRAPCFGPEVSESTTVYFVFVANTFAFHVILSFLSSSGPPNSFWGQRYSHRTWKRPTGRGSSAGGVASRRLRGPKFVDCYL